MKVLLDECIDWRLARDIVGHEVRTAQQMGWAAIKNGELLSRASEQFDVFPHSRQKSDLPTESHLVAHRGCGFASKNESTRRSQTARA